MGTQPDRRPGPSVEEELVLEADPADPTTPGAVRFNGTSFRMRDAVGVLDPRSGGGGITEGQHEILDSLVHDLAESCYTEIERSGGKVAAVRTWTTAAKIMKVREVEITRTDGKVSSAVEKQYDAAGVLVQTLTHTIARTGGKVSSVSTAEA
jgi:hypothetical protein